MRERGKRRRWAEPGCARCHRSSAHRERHSRLHGVAPGSPLPEAPLPPCPLPVLAVPSWLPQPPARGSSELPVSSVPIYSSGLFLGQAGAAGARGASAGTMGAAGTLPHAPHVGQLPVPPSCCCALGTQGLSWHRHQLGLAGLRGILWHSVGLGRALWGSMGPHGIQQVLMGLCGAQQSSLGLHGALWSSLGPSGAPWGPAELQMTPRVSTGLRGGRQVPLGGPCPSVARG